MGNDEISQNNHNTNKVNQSITNNKPLTPIKQLGILELNKYLNKLCKSVCKIETQTKDKGTGFLMKLEKGNNPFYCLISNEHVIKEQMIKSKEYISIFYDLEKINI